MENTLKFIFKRRKEMFWIGFGAAYVTGLILTMAFLLIEEGMKTKRKKWEEKIKWYNKDYDNMNNYLRYLYDKYDITTEYYGQWLRDNKRD